MKVIVNPIKTPDVNAMAQAFYSRSFTSIEDRIKDLNEDQLRQSLNKYYIGYGHESIGDCGVITVYCEGVTLLTAKALQDNPLYNGQESSTRYIDFKNCTFSGGQSTADLHNDGSTHAKWVDFYERAYSELTSKFSKTMDEKAASLRAFDIARGLLPVTAQTNVSVTMSFRQLAHQLHSIAQYHPIGVVREEGYQILKEIKKVYADLMAEPKHLKQTWFMHWEETKELRKLNSINEVPIYDNPLVRDRSKCKIKYTEPYPLYGTVPDELLNTELFGFQIDYGSYRDLQRHRSLTMTSTLPLIAHGFHSWYWHNLPVGIRKEVAEFIKTIDQKDVLNSPLMAMVYVLMRAPLDKFIYTVNLRTKPTVHPTLRTLMSDLAYALDVNNDVLDLTEYDHSALPQDYGMRSTQDIVEK